MKRWTINNPEMMDGIKDSRFKPNTAITILIALAIYFAFIIVTAFGGVIFGVVYMAQQGANSIAELLTEMTTSQELIIFSLLITIALIILTIVHVQFIEKRRLATIGLKSQWPAQKYIFGFGLGVVLVAVTIVPALLTEDIVYNGFTPLFAIYLLAFIVQSASEEILFRGYILTGVASKIGVIWAVCISSALFASIHLINGGASILSMISLFLIGAMLALYVVRTNNIWGACGIHAAWNFTLGSISPIFLAGFNIDYAVITVGDPSAQLIPESLVGDPGHLISIGVFLIAILLMLFVGKKRLVVEKQAEEEPPPDLDEGDDMSAE